MLLDEIDAEIEFSLRPDDELTTYGISHREKLIERIEQMYDKVVKFRPSSNKYVNMINNLTLSLELWLDGYEFDDEDPIKLRELLNHACVMIGKPRTMEEMADMLGIDLESINDETNEVSS